MPVRGFTYRRSGWNWVGWTQREDTISRKTVEVAGSGRSPLFFFFSCFFSSLTHWMETLEGIHEQSVLGRSEKRDSDLRFMNSAFISSPIGLANKLVQFKKRPLYSCSLKAAYTQKKTLWEEPLISRISKHEKLHLDIKVHPVVHS